MTAYWLMKSEPTTFSIDDLMACKNQTDHWDGIRNYQARNFMRDHMKVGDKVLFYHSSCKVPAIVGTATISKAAYPDHTAFDPNSPYYDPKSSKATPRWVMVEVTFKKKFKHPIPLTTLKATPGLENMQLLKKGNRLSILPITQAEWQIINRL